MKIAAAFILACVAFAHAGGETESNDTGFYNYHIKIGAPAAEKIRRLEKNITPVENRIVGGGTTTTLSIPHQVGLIITFRLVQTSVCGATLISDSRVLTAGHCYNDGNSIAQSYTVVLGSNLLFSGGTRITTTDFVVYPGYNPRIIANDLGIIRIPRVTFSLTIQPINLPSGSELNLDYTGYTALASGYGATRDGDGVGLLQTLSSVNLRVINNNECRNVYGNTIQGTHLCTNGAGGVGVCHGDTGGPLTTTVNSRRILIGISSFVSTRGCQAGQPSGFTRVSSYTNWIHSI
ncbi:brachyurin-like [Anticarsia gemmatalis]|uniref:brachyurin-like n=1 Tax=Anticarsia gemmatalis TaxID=129554 RepID=UPI003F769224